MNDELDSLLKRLEKEKQELLRQVSQNDLWFACFVWNSYYEDFRVSEPTKGYVIANGKLKEYVNGLKE